MLKRVVCFFGSVYFGLLPKKKPDFSRVKKVMVIKPGAIGDILMTTPFLMALRKRFPKAKIHFYIGKWSAPILGGNPNIDSIVIFDDRIIFEKRIGELYKLIKRIRKERYDIGFILDRSYLANLFVYFCNIPVRVGFDRNGEGFPNTIKVPYNDSKHDIEFYLDLGKAVDVSAKGKKMDIFLKEREIKFARDFLNKNGLKKSDLIVGISPGGGKNPGQTVFLKRWFKDRYIELCNKLIKDYKAKIIFFGGPDDANLIEEIQKSVKDKTFNSAGLANLMESAALMGFCKLFICNDSGPMHMAAAMDVPTISIFGPTDPVKLAPLGEKHIMIRKKLDCMPCYHDGRFPNCKHQRCMKLVKVEDVLKAVEKTIRK